MYYNIVMKHRSLVHKVQLSVKGETGGERRGREEEEEMIDSRFFTPSQPRRSHQSDIKYKKIQEVQNEFSKCTIRLKRHTKNHQLTHTIKQRRKEPEKDDGDEEKNS